MKECHGIQTHYHDENTDSANSVASVFLNKITTEPTQEKQSNGIESKSV